jgi:hypothetical protein
MTTKPVLHGEKLATNCVSLCTNDFSSQYDFCPQTLPLYEFMNFYTLMKETAATASSGTLAEFRWITRHHIPEDGSLHSHLSENLK